MRIDNNYNNYISSFSPLKSTQSFSGKTTTTTTTSDIKTGSILSFFPLFRLKETPVDARNLTHPIKMEPFKEYLVDSKNKISLGGFEVDLGDWEVKKQLRDVRINKEVTLGHIEFQLKGMDSSVSRRHMKLKKLKDRHFIISDLNSRNGSYISENIIKPDNKNSAFCLERRRNYLLPPTSVFVIGCQPFFLSKHYDKISNLKNGESVIVGTDASCDIKVRGNSVSGKHLRIEKSDNKVIVTDLNSVNGTIYAGVDSSVSINNSKRNNYSANTKVMALEKGVPTLLPKDSQLYLGKDFTIDIRNKNILGLFEKKNPLLIGKDANCDLVVDDFYSSVSEKHILLQKTEEGIYAVDIDLNSPTFVIPKNKIKPFYLPINALQLKQGNIGDCYLLASLYALSRNKKGEKLLENLVRVDDNGNYVVKFAVGNEIVVKPEELDGQKRDDGSEKRSVSGALGIKAIERAYAKLIKKPKQDMNDTMFLDIDNGGKMSIALKKIAGLESYRVDPKKDSIEQIFNLINTEPKENYLLTCATPMYPTYNGYADPAKRFDSLHAYAVSSFDTKAKTVDIINPHNTRNVQTISWNDFKLYFSQLCFTHFPD